MRAVVTGGNGFVGSAVVRCLLERGYDVTALVGADLDATNLEGVPAERRDVDVTDPASVRAALEGGEVLVHTAAVYAFWHPTPDVIYRVNVGGTRTVLSTAVELGYRRIVYTSSVATLSPAYPGLGSAEDAVYDVRRFGGDYKSSKVMAESVAMGFAARGAPVVIVNPTVPVGVGDLRPTPTGEMIVHFLRGHLRVCPDITLSVVDVEDVALGHVLALEKGTVGERYVLDGEQMTLVEMARLLSGLTGIRPPVATVPLGVLLAVGRVSEWAARHVTRKPPAATVEAALHARAESVPRASKARTELGYDPKPAAEALAKAVRWYQEHDIGAPSGRR